MTVCEFVDYYETLELSPNANSATIERVFRFLAEKNRPNPAASGHTLVFTQVVDAFNTLGDPAKRAAYDVAYNREKNAPNPIVASPIVAGPIVAGADVASDDIRDRYRILSILYAQRRRDMNKPGIGGANLELLVEMPPELLNFHMWYFREKGWVGREESGQISISAAGVEKIEAMNQEQISNPMPSGHRPGRLPATA